METIMRCTLLLACAGIAFVALPAVAQDRYLMALNSSSTAPGKRVMLFDINSGALVNDSFIHESTSPQGTWGTVKGIKQVGDFIYISDQTRNVVYRYDLAGNYLSSFGEGFLNNIRGFDYSSGFFYISNATAVAGGAQANSIARFDHEGLFLDSFVVGGSPFSVLVLGPGQLLVGHSSGTNDITRWDLTGNSLGVFHAGPISYVQQLNFKSNGNILAVGWSGTSVQGIYEFDLQGQQVGYWSCPAPRAAWELDSGNIFWTGSGFNIYDTTASSSIQVAAGTGQYLALLALGPGPCYANCDGSTTAPILNVEDFTCFINEFAAAQALPHEQQLTHYANCDQSTTAPVLNVEDFTCFINKFAQGCD
jgi:hypothetical protein